MIILIDDRALAIASATGARPRDEGSTKKEDAVVGATGETRDDDVAAGAVLGGAACEPDEMARFRVAHAMTTKRASHAHRIRFRLRMSR